MPSTSSEKHLLTHLLHTHVLWSLLVQCIGNKHINSVEELIVNVLKRI